MLAYFSASGNPGKHSALAAGGSPEHRPRQERRDKVAALDVQGNDQRRALEAHPFQPRKPRRSNRIGTTSPVCLAPGRQPRAVVSSPAEQLQRAGTGAHRHLQISRRPHPAVSVGNAGVAGGRTAGQVGGGHGCCSQLRAILTLVLSVGVVWFSSPLPPPCLIPEDPHPTGRAVALLALSPHSHFFSKEDGVEMIKTRRNRHAPCCQISGLM